MWEVIIPKGAVKLVAPARQQYALPTCCEAHSWTKLTQLAHRSEYILDLMFLSIRGFSDAPQHGISLIFWWMWLFAWSPAYLHTTQVRSLTLSPRSPYCDHLFPLSSSVSYSHLYMEMPNSRKTYTAAFCLMLEISFLVFWGDPIYMLGWVWSLLNWAQHFVVWRKDRHLWKHWCWFWRVLI